jgi:hypothetical protein
MNTVRLSEKTAKHICNYDQRKINALLSKNWILTDQQKDIVRQETENKWVSYLRLYNTVNKLIKDKPHLYPLLPQDIKNKLNGDD